VSDPSLYGNSFADVYDEWYGDVSDVQATVDVMTELASGGGVLELGVGTGRLAIPLAATGTPVTGVDSSSAMLKQLAANDHGRIVAAVEANMAELSMEPQYNAVFVAYNTIFNLTTIEEQQACFASVATALLPGGHFAVEAFVPDLSASTPDRAVTPTSLMGESAVLTATIRDRQAQSVTGQHIELRQDGTVKLRPWKIRYASPEQLDAMAMAAGFSLVERWDGWSRAPFSDESPRHVTIYRLNRSDSQQRTAGTTSCTSTSP